MESCIQHCGLPEDCLAIIFRKLDTLADRNAFGLTCRSWLLIQSSGRRSLSFQSCNPSSYTDHLPSLLTRFPHLTSLTLAGLVELPDQVLAPFREYGRRLRSLSLYYCRIITDEGAALVADACPQLVSLTLYRCAITDVGVESLARSCSSLESINLSYCSLVSDRGLQEVCRGCKRLRALTISYCRGITGAGFEGCPASLTFLEAESCLLTPEGLLRAVSGGGLEYLNLSCFRSWVGGDGVLDSIGLAGRMKVLNLRSCRIVGDRSVSAIARGCPLLEEWSLALCHEVGTQGWRAVAAWCSSLRVLHANWCRKLCDEGLLAIRDGCPRLRVMYLHGSRRVSDGGMEMFRLRRHEVELRKEDCVSMGPPADELFRPMNDDYESLPSLVCSSNCHDVTTIDDGGGGLP